MIRRTTKIAIEVIAGLIGVAALLLAVGIWRLSAGPVQLNFLTPRFEEALADPASGVTVDVGETQLVWAGWARTIDLHARDVAVRGGDGAIIAVLPDIVVGISLRALAQGTLAPSMIEVFGAGLSLVRGEDGKFAFGQRPGPAIESDSDPDMSRLLPSAFEQLQSKPDRNRPLSFLNEVRILDGRITIEDRRSGQTWQAPGAVIELRRDAAGLAGEVGLAIEVKGTRATVVAEFAYDKATGRVDLNGSAANLHPTAVSWLAPPLEVLAGLTTPLNATLTATGRADGTIDTLQFDLTGGAGQLAIADVLPKPLPVAEVRLRGDIAGVPRRVRLETAVVRFGTADQPGPEIDITATANSSTGDLHGDLDVQANVTVRNVPMAQLEHYWPVGAGQNERAWVIENVTQGVAEQVSLQATLQLPGGSVDAAEIRTLDGTMQYRDLEIHYMRPLPPVVGVSGDATFDKHSIAFRPTGGRLGALQVQPTTVDIAGLDAEDQTMAIDLAIVGPLRDGLELLDHDRLALIRRLGIATATVGGQAAARVSFRFPLLADLKIDDVEITAKANLEQTALDSFLLGQDVRDGRLSLALDKAGMELTGPVTLGGVGIELNWKEAFTDTAPYRSDLAAQVPQIDETQRKRFGFDLAPYLEGPVSAAVRMLTDHSGVSTLSAAINLQTAGLAVAPLGWQKPPGAPGEAHLTLRLAADRVAELTQFAIDAGTLRTEGRGQFAEAGGGLASLTLDELAIDETKVRKVAVTRLGEGYAIRIGGGTVDATPLVKGVDTASPLPKIENAPVAADAPAPPREPQTFTPLQLTADNLDRLIFGPDRYLQGVSVDFARGVSGWDRLVLRGDIPPDLRSEPPPGSATAPAVALSPAFSIDFQPDATGLHKLAVATEDMGGVLRALDLVDSVRRGNLKITGESDGPLPARPLTASIDATDYVLVNATLLTRLLTVASLTGIVDLLKGQGITFSRLVGDVTLEDGTLTTELVRAYGPALGLTVKGAIDFDESIVNLEGTVVPAYTVNRILGEIPLIGRLLIGGEGEGFVAVIYHVSGSLAEPEVSVNPLSALTPGFLRGLFGLFESGEKPTGDDKPVAVPKSRNAP